MRGLKFLMLAAISGVSLAAIVPKADAQVSVRVGLAPDCPYGYYDSSPYGCAPFGYYGPEWFHRRIFIGAGPWFHGPRHFHGYVNNDFHPERGYSGPMPSRGEKWDRSNHMDRAHFKGNEQRDGRGHTYERGH